MINRNIFTVKIYSVQSDNRRKKYGEIVAGEKYCSHLLPPLCNLFKASVLNHYCAFCEICETRYIIDVYNYYTLLSKWVYFVVQYTL